MYVYGNGNITFICIYIHIYILYYSESMARCLEDYKRYSSFPRSLFYPPVSMWVMWLGYIYSLGYYRISMVYLCIYDVHFVCVYLAYMITCLHDVVRTPNYTATITYTCLHLYLLIYSYIHTATEVPWSPYTSPKGA